MNSRAMDGTGSSSRAAALLAKSNFKKKRLLRIGSLWLAASFVLLGCCVSADEKADGVTRAPDPPTAAAAAASITDRAVASLTSTVSPSHKETSDLAVTIADTVEKTSSAEPALISSTMTYEATTRFDAEWSAELLESGEATPTPTSAGPPLPSEPGPAAPSTAPGSPAKSPSSWPWMVFVLSGNSTVAGRRQRDLGTYLRLNLAARLDADYNDVAINRIALSPHSVVANISVEPSHLLTSGLDALGQGNVTLLELSGTEFQVERIIRFDEALDQREMMSLEMGSVVAAGGSEVTVYGAVGAVFLFLLVALLLGLSFNSPCRSSITSGGTAKYLSDSGYERDQTELVDLCCVAATAPSCPPPVIYSEELAREMCDSASLLPRSYFIPAWPSAVAGQRYLPDRLGHEPRITGRRANLSC